MQSQLVLKFRHRPSESAAYIDALTQQLAPVLAPQARLDGHDVRADAINLFILTPDPVAAFRRAKPVLEGLGLLDKVVAAHRFEGGVAFKVIWPLKWGRRFHID